MSDIINILPDSVANQIAAGEVVDRPASAVKELLENALDAGATNIQLIVKDAGRTLIQVIDDGCGMSDSDARLCFERHATSKIHQADDLFAIRSMGFRGEALASIAAVAQVELKTRQHENELGTSVTIEGSDVKDQVPCTCPVGTSIAVKNLFYNIPARRNFLKKDSIELSHIEDVFRRVALPNYQISFSFHHNGRLLYDLKACNFAQRISAMFGTGYNQRLYHIEEHTEPVTVKGYVGKAEYAKRARGEQYIFVNGRYIKHFGMSAAIEKAYTELIPERTYPAYFILLDVDPQRIDVNIHPTKTEVRFIDEQMIFAILRAATKKALGQFSLANEIEFNPSQTIDFTPRPTGYTPRQPQVSFNPNYNPFHASMPRNDAPKPSLDDYRNFFGSMEATVSPQLHHDSESTDLGSQVTDQGATINNSTIQSITFLNKYIVTTLKSGIAIIDQQRAMERIIYERLVAQRSNGQPDAQQLLFPVNCTFNAGDSEVLSEIMPDLRNLGFVIEPLGQCTFVVTATPSDVKDTEIQNILEHTIAEYKSSQLQKFSERDKSVCLSLARQMAATTAKELKEEEKQKLIADLFCCQAPDIAPSGKKTIFIISENDITERLK